MPLEHRRWFNLCTLALSLALMYGLWRASALAVTLTTVHLYLFASLGLFLGVHRLVALAFIKARPALGDVG